MQLFSFTNDENVNQTKGFCILYNTFENVINSSKFNYL